MTAERDEWAGWVATIRPTPADNFGIYWSNAPAMERRGGYSGPYRTRAEAEAGARIWLGSWDVTDYRIEHRDEPEPIPDWPIDHAEGE